MISNSPKTLSRDNLTKTNRKTPKNTAYDIKMEEKIAQLLSLDDQENRTAK